MGGVRVSVPLVVASVPLQVPDDVHLVAFTDDQVIEVEAPRTMEFDPSVSVGSAGGAATIRLTMPGVDEPTALAHVSEYVSVPPAVGVRVWLPLTGNVPLQLPEAVQLAAYAEDQVIVDDWPKLMELALRARVGAAGATSVKFTDVVADVPAALEQVSVKELDPVPPTVTD